MKKRLSNFFVGGRKFRNEFRRQLRSLIIIALGFTIAFSWRETFFDLSQELVQMVINVKSSASLAILTSLFITFFAVILIYLTSYFLRDKEPQ
jgi:hypothetical protein